MQSLHFKFPPFQDSLIRKGLSKSPEHSRSKLSLCLLLCLVPSFPKNLFSSTLATSLIPVIGHLVRRKIAKCYAAARASCLLLNGSVTVGQFTLFLTWLSSTLKFYSICLPKSIAIHLTARREFSRYFWIKIQKKKQTTAL